MKKSIICKDLYPIIMSFADWETLQKMKMCNKYIYSIAKKEISRRIETKYDYPLNERNTKLSIYVNDTNISSISLIVNGKSIYIPKDKYRLSFIFDTLNEWFIFSLEQSRLIMTTKLFKAIIRVVNKKIFENDKTLIGEKNQELIFGFRNINSGKTFLENVK